MEKHACTQPVGNVFPPSRRTDPKKLLLKTVVGLSIGFVVTSWWSSDSFFNGVSSLSFVSKALRTTNLSRTDHKSAATVPVGESVSERRFSVSLDRTLSERGLNLITAVSGCHLAAWVFQGGGPNPFFIDCNLAQGRGDLLGAGEYHASQQLDPGTIRHIQSYDTIYVNARGLAVFVETILSNITTPIVLLVGQYHHNTIQFIPEETEMTLLNTSCIVRLFAHNLEEYFHQPHHPKLAPWPYGIQPYSYGRNRTHPWPSEFLSEAFWRLQNDKNSTKTKGIMHGYIKKRTNPKRKNIPSGPKLDYAEYYDEIARHRFILSPDGDRPECFRTYEAIAMGTIPITELSASLHRHLQPAPILFETSDWNLNETQAMERLGVAQFPTVNRMLVLEEYWLDYVEREVGGRSLRWFDSLALKKAKLDEFQILTNEKDLLSGVTAYGHG